MITFKKSKSGNYYANNNGNLYLSTTMPNGTTPFAPTGETTDEGSKIYWNTNDIVVLDKVNEVKLTVS